MKLTEIVAKEYPEPRWAVPSILPEGLTILAGKPKLGKSWLALNLALAIGSGSKALGSKQCEQGAVLYLALEDNDRRIKERTETVLSGEPVPDSVDVYPSGNH